MFVNQSIKRDPIGVSGFGSSSQMGGPWGLLQAGIQDTVGFAVGRRDRDHAEHREDRLLREERAWQEMMAKNMLSYRVKDAKKAGLHPLAALGAQLSSPVISQPQAQVPVYPEFGKGIPSQAEVAQARLLNKQADLIDEQIADSRIARATHLLSNDKLHDDVVAPQRTSHLHGGTSWKTNPNFSDAQTYTDRYGESELLEMVLNLVIGAADVKHNIWEGARNADRSHPAAPGYDLPPELRKKLFGGK